MRKIFFIAALTITAQISFAQTKISIDSISTNMGETVQICSKVYGIKSLDKVTFINLGSAYPNSPLTIVIFAKDLLNFNSTPEELYKSKQICVTGKLAEYKGKPQIVVTKPDEIIVQ